MGTEAGGTPPKDGEPAEKDGLDDVEAVAAEPGPAAPVAAEVAAEVAADDARRASSPALPDARVVHAPPLRESMPAIGDDMPVTFPDDGPLAAGLRKVDHVLGNAEQAVLFALLAIVVVTGAVQGLAGKLAGKSWPATYFIVRTGVLAIAMIGAAFASHQQRHLAMDLVSRRLPPRGRLVLRIFLGAVTIFVTGIVVASVWRLFNQVRVEVNANDPLPPWLSPMTLPLGGGLIILHTLIHLVIDADYLARGKLPPERARSAH